MTPKKMWVATVFSWIATVGFAGIAASFLSVHTEQLFEKDPDPAIISDLQNSFSQKQSIQDVLRSPSFLLSPTDRQVRLPDLRGQLLFFGCNERPDKLFSSPCIQFGIRGTQAVYSGHANEKQSLKFDCRSNRWLVSESPTPLTVTFSPRETVSDITVELKTDKGDIVTTPHEFHFFWVPTSPPPQGTASTEKWELGSLVVDPSLFDRQGAIWWGQDEVVKALGGDEMSHQACRERVQFTSSDSTYVVWMKEKDCFLYENDRWINVEPGEATVGKPILMVKTVDSKAIQLELWNSDGSQHATFSIPRRNATVPTRPSEVRLLGAKSRKQWIAEIQRKKVVLSPDDWVIVNGDEITLIDSEELLDDYLEGVLTGNLLVFQGFEKIEGESCLVGTFFDATRTHRLPFSVSLYRSWNNGKGSPSKEQNDDDEFDDDEDFNDNDFPEEGDENVEFEDDEDVQTSEKL